MAQRSPTLAAIEAEVADSTDDMVHWFEVLSRYEPLRSWADQLDEEERRLIVCKFRLFRAFEKHIMAEFRLEDIAGYLIPANGDIRSRVCLAALRALLAAAVRKGRRKGDFESLERPTYRVDSACYELRPRAMKQDEVDDVEMAFRKVFTIVDGRKAEVRDIEQALRWLFELRGHQVLVEDPPPLDKPKTPPARPGSDTVSIVCPNPSCRTRLRVLAKYAGRRVKCPKCGRVFNIPEAAAG